MSDPIDRAQAREEELRDDALDNVRRRLPSVSDSSRECRVCDEPIPEERRRAVPGCSTCIDCQRELEQAAHWGMAE